MKVYLASKFKLKERVKKIAKELEKSGHEITVKWWTRDYKKLKLNDYDWYRDDRIFKVCSRNYRGVVDADVVVLVCHESRSQKFTGANIEIGIAMGLKKEVYSIGKLERSAMYSMVRQTTNISELLNGLRHYQTN